MEYKKLALVVLGCHRSGTSVMTRVTALCGFSLPNTLLPPQPDNPAGFWESSVVVNLNNEILGSTGAHWDDVFPPARGDAASSFSSDFFAKAEAAIASEFNGASQIVLKDPRISLLADFWVEVLALQGYESVLIIMVRDPVEVAASLAKRNGFSRDRALLIWLTNMLAAERLSRGRPRLFIAYDRLLNAPLDVLDDIGHTLGTPLVGRTRSAENNVQLALDRELHHHRTSGPLIPCSELEQIVADVYDWLCKGAGGEEPQPEPLDSASGKLAFCEQVVGGAFTGLKQDIMQFSIALEEERSRAALLQRDLSLAEAQTIRQRLDVRVEQARLAAVYEALLAEKIASSHLQDRLQCVTGSLKEVSRRLLSASVELRSVQEIRKAELEELQRLRVEAESLRRSIIHIQSSRWWRAISRLKRLANREAPLPPDSARRNGESAGPCL